eukprot:TRINITY_DN19446_c0_g1_i2.p2 TRINITY_DN19446_c0_g1~~TRINITY_DN19446_c0_g1_i2.p2  ORF type:complete len:210 (+),score=44.45 TRINITY_DN19446_c0_g1_i2:194-823(+)
MCIRDRYQRRVRGAFRGGMEEESEPMIQTNQEKETVALPVSWTKNDLTACKLYGMLMSPPCRKVMGVLEFYGINFEFVDGKKPGSAYQKIPVLDVGGIQINDSYVMVTALAPILQGEPMTPEEVAIEETTTFGAMLALEEATVNQCCGGGLRGCGWHVGCRMGCKGCCICCAFYTCGPCMGCCVGGKMRAGFQKKCQKMTGNYCSSHHY